jgi:hypothetical protein
MMKKGCQHRLDGTVAAVDHQEIDAPAGEIRQGSRHVLRFPNVAVNYPVLIIENAADLIQAIQITSAERIDNNAYARWLT